MKHIFIVHSNITYLASLGVIVSKHIPQEDVLIISDGFTTKGPIEVHPIVIESDKRLLRKSLKSYIKVYFTPTTYLYKLIDNFLCGDEFVAYISVFHLIKKYVVLHPNCKGFHFIEEGTASYMRTFSLNEYAFVYLGKSWMYKKGIGGLKDRVLTAFHEFGHRSNKINTIPLYYNSFDAKDREFWGFSDLSHPAVVNGEKKILDIPFISDALSDYFTDMPDYSNASIWIGDPDIYMIIGDAQYKETIQTQLIPAIKGKKLYVRFHYRESRLQRETFLSFLDEMGVKYEIVPDNLIMEFVFAKATNCQVYGIYSSLLMYAKFLNHSCFSIAKSIPQCYNTILELMPVYSNFVEYL